MKISGLVRALLVSALFAFAALPCFSADSPFVGNWKLDTAKSKFTGSTFTYTMTPAGLLHFSDGAFEGDFDPSGKPHQTFSNIMTTWTKVDDHTWDDVSEIGDKMTGKSHKVLSADGNTLTVEGISYRPDGTPDETLSVYKRVSGGPGLVGTWKNVKTDAPTNRFSLSMQASGQITYEDPDYKVTTSGPTDGTFFAVKGPTVPEGITNSFKLADATTLEYINKMNDKVVSKGVMTVTGSTLTDVSWTAGKEDEKTTAVYHKQ